MSKGEGVRLNKPRGPGGVQFDSSLDPPQLIRDRFDPASVYPLPVKYDRRVDACKKEGALVADSPAITEECICSRWGRVCLGEQAKAFADAMPPCHSARGG